MNERKIKEIERLIGKFFDGETTLREEQRLYEFFARRSVPARLQGYREVFAGFASMQAWRAPPSEVAPRAYACGSRGGRGAYSGVCRGGLCRLS